MCYKQIQQSDVNIYCVSLYRLVRFSHIAKHIQMEKLFLSFAHKQFSWMCLSQSWKIKQQALLAYPKWENMTERPLKKNFPLEFLITQRNPLCSVVRTMIMLLKCWRQKYLTKWRAKSFNSSEKKMSNARGESLILFGAN